MAVAYHASSLLETTLEPINVPCTLACFFQAADQGANRTLVFLDNSLGGPHHWLFLDGGRLHAETKWAGTATAAVPYTVGAWSHACAVFAAGNDRRVYLNGGFQGTNLAEAVWGPCNRLRALDTGYNSPLVGGAVAEKALWNAALNDADIEALAHGISALRIRPESLVAYWPLGGRFGQSLRDCWHAHYDLSVSGSVGWVRHPGVFYPRPVLLGSPGLSAARRIRWHLFERTA